MANILGIKDDKKIHVNTASVSFISFIMPCKSG